MLRALSIFSNCVESFFFKSTNGLGQGIGMFLPASCWTLGSRTMNLNIDVTHIFENAFSGTFSQQHNKEFSWASDLLNKQKRNTKHQSIPILKRKNQQELTSFSILLSYIGPFLSSQSRDKLYWKCYKYLISCWSVLFFFKDVCQSKLEENVFGMKDS